MKLLRSTLVCVLLAAAVWCAIPLHSFLASQQQAGKAEVAIIASVREALAGKHANGDDGLLFLSRNALQNADAAMNAIKQTAQDANRIAKEQTAKTSELADESIALVKTGTAMVGNLGVAVGTLNSAIAEVKTVVTNTDLQLNDGALPALTDTLRSTTAALNALDGPSGLMAEGAIAAKSAAVLLSDPHWPEVIAHIDAMTASAATGTQNGAEMLGYIRDDLKPTKASLRQIIISRGIAALPDALIQLFLRKFDPDKVELIGTGKDLLSYVFSQGRRSRALYRPTTPRGAVDRGDCASAHAAYAQGAGTPRR